MLARRIGIGPERVRAEHISSERPGPGRRLPVTMSAASSANPITRRRMTHLLFSNLTTYEAETVSTRPGRCQLCYTSEMVGDATSRLQRIAIERVARNTGEPGNDIRRGASRCSGSDELDYGSHGCRRVGHARGRSDHECHLSLRRLPDTARPERQPFRRRLLRRAFVSSRQTATSRSGSAPARLVSAAGRRFGDSNATVG